MAVTLRRQNLTIPFAGGIDTKTDPFQVESHKMSRLENMVFTKLRQLKKRNGYSALGRDVSQAAGSSQLTEASALTSFKDQLVAVAKTTASPNKSSLFSYSEGANGWVSRGTYTPCSVSSTSVASGTVDRSSSNSVRLDNGIEIHVWEQSTSVMYSAIDSASGHVIVAPTQLAANACKPCVVKTATAIVGYYVNTSSSRIYSVLFYVSSSVSVSSPAIAVTDVIAGNVATLSSVAAKQNYDVQIINYGAGPVLFLAFGNDAGGITVRSYNPSSYSTLLAQQSIAGFSPDCLCVSGFGQSNQICVTFGVSNVLRNSFATGELASAFSAPNTIYTASALEPVVSVSTISIGDPSSYGFSIFASTDVSGFRTTRIFKTDGITVSSSLPVYGTSIASKAWSIDSTPFIALAGISYTTGSPFPLQNQLFVVSGSTDFADIVSRSYYGTHAGAIASYASGSPVLPFPTVDQQGTVSISCVVASTISSSDGLIQSNDGIVSFGIDFNSAPVSDNRSEIGGSLVLGGGVLNQYDGSSMVELGFHYWPDRVSITVNSATSGSLGVGKYSYVACYEWTDQNGFVHRSAPSLPQSFTTPSSNYTLQVSVSTLIATRKQSAAGRDGCKIVLYRTTANGSTYYRVPAPGQEANNTVGLSSVLISDGASDASIESNPVLYTTGGVVENIVSAPMQSLVMHRGRLWGIDMIADNTLWYSRQITPNAPVEFSDVFEFMVDNRGGEVTALASLDDKLIVFKKNLIMMISGQGPDAQGGQNDFSDAVLVTSDCGCIDSRSIVTVPSGIMFQSDKGIYLLTRSLEAKYIGAEVEAYNQQEVLSAQLIPDANQVRFVMSSGVALVYDYYVEQWAVFTNHNAVDTVNWRGKFCYLRADGTVMKEDPTRYDDNGSFVKMTAATSWIKFSTDAGEYIAVSESRMPMTMQGFQRAYKAMILGEYINEHKLNVSVSYDFQDAPLQYTVVTPPAQTLLYGYDDGTGYGGESPYGGDWKPYQWRIDFARQKCQAVKITISDEQVASSNKESVRLSAIALDLGLKPGLNRVPMSNVLG